MQDINVSNRSQADVHALSRVGQYKGPSPAAVKDVRRLYQGFIQCKYNMPRILIARAHGTDKHKIVSRNHTHDSSWMRPARAPVKPAL